MMAIAMLQKNSFRKCFNFAPIDSIAKKHSFDPALVEQIEMYPGKWTDEIVTNPLYGQMKKGHSQLADRSLTT
jgi:hypothetical protein